MNRAQLANMTKAAKVVEQNARDLLLQVENLTETIERNDGSPVLSAGDLVVAAERIQEAVFSMVLFRRTLEADIATEMFMRGVDTV